MDATQWSQHNGGHHQHHNCPTTSLSPSEVCEIVGNVGCNVVKVEICFYNNVVIDNMVVDTDVYNSDWECYSTRGVQHQQLHQHSAPTTSEQQGVLHTTVFSRIFQRQPTEEIIGIHIDIDIQEEDIDIECNKFRQRLLNGQLNLQQRLLGEQLRAQHGPSSAQQFCWTSTLGIAQPRSSTTSSRSSSTSCSTIVLSSSTSGAHNSTSCHRWSLIVPSKGVTTTRCTSTSEVNNDSFIDIIDVISKSNFLVGDIGSPLLQQVHHSKFIETKSSSTRSSSTRAIFCEKLIDTSKSRLTTSSSTEAGQQNIYNKLIISKSNFLVDAFNDKSSAINSSRTISSRSSSTGIHQEQADQYIVINNK